MCYFCFQDVLISSMQGYPHKWATLGATFPFETKISYKRVQPSRCLKNTVTVVSETK